MMHRKLLTIIGFLITLYSCEQGQNTGSGRSSGYAATKNFYSGGTKDGSLTESPLKSDAETSKDQAGNTSSDSEDEHEDADAEDEVSGLYTKNEKDPIGVNIGETVVRETPRFVGGEADCSIHINRHPGDPCAYDFCGDASSNEHLSEETYKTVVAIMDYLKASNQISSCSNDNVISILENTTSLDLSSKELSDINPLGFMKKLVTLNLENNQIKDLYPLRNMLKLESLNISKNNIDYLNALSSLTNLKEIYATHNNLTRITELTSLASLEYLNIAYNNVTSIIPLSSREIEINVAENEDILLEAKKPPPEDLPQGNCDRVFEDTGEGDVKPSCYLGHAYLIFNPTIDTRSQ